MNVRKHRASLQLALDVLLLGDEGRRAANSVPEDLHGERFEIGADEAGNDGIAETFQFAALTGLESSRALMANKVLDE